MTNDKETRLKDKFSKIFDSDFYFEHGDGWYSLLEDLCSVIQSHIDWRAKVADMNGTETDISQVMAVQVKEKFGGLRFYYDGGDSYIRGAVDMAEYMSEKTCEACGKPGRKTMVNRWLRTVCDEHGSVE